MHPMPKGDPWPEITRVLAAEAAIRTGGSTAAAINTSMDPYWADLVRLLEVFAAKRRKDIAGIKAIALRCQIRFTQSSSIGSFVNWWQVADLFIQSEQLFPQLDADRVRAARRARAGGFPHGTDNPSELSARYG
jgi:hypothetical protein